MHLLVLGGTVFLGRHIVDAALTRGHTVTLFNRGRHGRALFPGVERLVGDRDGDVSALQGRRFDAAIDCSGYRPDQVARSTEALAGGVGHMTFISSISAYARFAPAVSYDEAAPLALGDVGYGAHKARAEETIAAALPGQVACVRPGLIAGPYDSTGRFTYWPVRIARGGTVLAPGRPARLVQFIDARDLAAFCITLAETGAAGPFNAIGPGLPMAELLDACRNVTGSDARFAWRADTTLLANEVAPWTGLPLWLPETDPESGGMMLADTTRARAAGLRVRPLHSTVADTLAWAAGPDRIEMDVSRQVATLTPQRELEILAATSA